MARTAINSSRFFSSSRAGLHSEQTEDAVSELMRRLKQAYLRTDKEFISPKSAPSWRITPPRCVVRVGNGYSHWDRNVNWRPIPSILANAGDHLDSDFVMGFGDVVVNACVEQGGATEKARIDYGTGTQFLSSPSYSGPCHSYFVKRTRVV
mmetsp:Transcript_58539/g.69835  ORF Transcript_58539/g.69835 Transcript_58539/m.69835 type:complete len:151 (-) Transcript_58539:126-578(-)